MSERTLVPIFVFWAILTIITPTLVLLSSENSKLDHLNGKLYFNFLNSQIKLIHCNYFFFFSVYIYITQ